MRRRDSIAGLGSAVAWPAVVRAQPGQSMHIRGRYVPCLDRSRSVAAEGVYVVRQFVARLPGVDKLRRLAGTINGLDSTVTRIELQARINSSFSRAAATACLRSIDPLKPSTWEFSGFSQHGEDGVIDYLCAHMIAPNRFFFEIGAADGIQNCTAWLAFARGYGGVWVEGDAVLCERARLALEGVIWNVHVINRYVEPERVPALFKMCPHLQPDVLSLDIDGVDYHIAKRILEIGFRPKVWVVEYNSAFGPDRAVTVPYSPAFSRWSGDPSGLYYGCSINGWRRLFSSQGYHFVSVESSGCNAFFIDPAAFPSGWAPELRGETFRDNDGDNHGAARPFVDAEGDDALPLRDWRKQAHLIMRLPLVEIA
jgi:hypothetical protein